MRYGNMIKCDMRSVKEEENKKKEYRREVDKREKRKEKIAEDEKK